MSFRPLITLSVLLCIYLFSAGCGYQLGTVKPPQMKEVQSLFITMPDNRTQYPRLEAKLSNHLADALIQDGQYQINSFNNADAKLVTQITGVGYNQIRSSRTDALRPEELMMKVTVSWEVVSLNEEKPRVLMSGSQLGTTRFFLEENLQIAQQNAFPDALKRVSRQIISSFSIAL